MKITKAQLVKIIKEEIKVMAEKEEEIEKIMTKPSALGDKKYAGTLKFIEQVLNIAPPEVQEYMAQGRNGSVIKRAIARLVHDVARGQERWYEEIITHTFEEMRNQRHFEALKDVLFDWDEAVMDQLNWRDLLDLSGYGPAGE